MERVSAAVDYSTETRATTTEAGTTNNPTIGVRQVRQSSIRVGKQLRRFPETIFKLAASPQDFFARFDLGRRSKIDVRPCMSPELEATLV